MKNPKKFKDFFEDIKFVHLILEWTTPRLLPSESNMIHLYWFLGAGGSWGLGGRAEDLFPIQRDVFDVCNARGHFYIVVAACCRCLFLLSNASASGAVLFIYFIYLLVRRIRDECVVDQRRHMSQRAADRWLFQVSDLHVGLHGHFCRLFIWSLDILFVILLEQDAEDSWPPQLSGPVTGACRALCAVKWNESDRLP